MRAIRRRRMVRPLPFPGPPSVRSADPVFVSCSQSMSEPPPPSGNADAGKFRKLLPILLGAAGLLIGIAGGAFVGAPLLAGRVRAPSAADSTSKERGKQAKAAKDAPKEGTGSEANPAALYTVDNLVMNPAGTSGTRFIMVTVAIQLAEVAQVDALKQRDAELRDLIVGLFSRKTVDELADAARRDSLRAEVTAVVSPLVPRNALRRVFFPQFVIQ